MYKEGQRLMKIMDISPEKTALWTSREDVIIYDYNHGHSYPFKILLTNTNAGVA